MPNKSRPNRRLVKSERAQTDTPHASESPSKQQEAFPVLAIHSHRALGVAIPEINRRLNASPKMAKLLVVNPAMVFRALGLRLSASLIKHVVESVRLPNAALRQRYDDIKTRLTKAFGQAPRPQDPRWVAWALFDQIKLAPLETANQTPIYQPILDAATERALQKLRPVARKKYDLPEAHRPAPSGIRVRFQRKSPIRFNLDAPVPSLERAKTMPTEITLEELYFYKDHHPLARELLEYAIIQRSTVSIQTAAAFRKIAAGQRSHALAAWIDDVRFPEGADHEPDR